MKCFYIETDKLLTIIRPLRYYYIENEKGEIFIEKIVDPAKNEEIKVKELLSISGTNLLNIQTAHLGNYDRTYVTAEND
jgi:hypothetical protein